MRTRLEIERLTDVPQNPSITDWNVRLQKASLEVLLDIRDLLLKEDK